MKFYSLFVLAVLICSSFSGVDAGVVDDSVKVKPFADTIREDAPSILISDMGSGWSAVYGSISYVDGALTGAPANGGLRFQKTFATPINLKDCNIGFMMRTTGIISSSFPLSLDFYDNLGRARTWRASGGFALGGDGVWGMRTFTAEGYAVGSAADMSKVVKIVFRFTSASSGWTVSVDDLRGYPVTNLFPNGAVIFTFDGPYERQLTWALPILAEYGYAGVVATAQDCGTASIRAQLGTFYAAGWDVCVYSRMFSTTDPVTHYSREQVLGFALAQKAWLDAQGFTRSSSFLQCNRHLIDVYVMDALKDYFYFVKGNSYTLTTSFQMPVVEFTGVSRTPAEDLRFVDSANNDGEVYVWFNHLKASTSVDYTEAQFRAFVQHVHDLGMEVVTYSQLLARYQATFVSEASGSLSLSLSGGVYSVVENGVAVSFATRAEALGYVEGRLSAWGGVK